MAKRTRKVIPTAGDPYIHGDKALNTPTEQVRKYLEPKDTATPELRIPPKSIALDRPQLRWQTERPDTGWSRVAPRLYTQEKIVPANFVRQLTQDSRHDDLFKVVNDLPETAHYAPYTFEGGWLNRLIRGESTEVMAGLLQHEGMAGKVQMVYFDPPYGINFDSEFQADTRLAKDPTKGDASKARRKADPETQRAFRDRYKNGVHSYLDALHRNLVFIRELLADSGHVFVQIGDDNMMEVGLVMQEVFGKENRMGIIPFAKTTTATSKGIAHVCDYLIWFAKHKDKGYETYNPIFEPRSRAELIRSRGAHCWIQEKGKVGTCRPLKQSEKDDPSTIRPGDKLVEMQKLSSPHWSATRSGGFTYKGRKYYPTPSPETAQWAVSEDALNHLASINRLHGTDKVLNFVKYEDESPGRALTNMWVHQQSPKNKKYVVQTAESVVERCMLMTTKPGDLVLDPTNGSGTTAIVAERQGRRWIAIDAAPTAIAITRQRILVAIHDYHLLQDSPEGAAKERELGGVSLKVPEGGDYGHDVRKGFVYLRSKKVSASIIAENEPIPVVNLINQPVPKPGVLRPSSAFCVQNANSTECLPASDAHDLPADLKDVDYATRHGIENALTTAGIMIPDGGGGHQRILVENLQTYGDTDTGGWISHTADLRMADESVAPAAIMMAKPHTRVSQIRINRAAEEAANMGNVTHLVALGFEFEAGVDRKRQEKRGRLNILKARANADLAIPEAEDSNRDHAFVVLGEPEIELTTEPDGRHRVILEGFYTYDPGTGNLRPAGTDEIECWLLDTRYDEKQFKAREIHLLTVGGGVI